MYYSRKETNKSKKSMKRKALKDYKNALLRFSISLLFMNILFDVKRRMLVLFAVASSFTYVY